MRKPRAKKPTVYAMNAEQDTFWINAFNDAKDRGRSDLQADAAAYKAVVKKWPEIGAFEKLSPKVRAEGTK